MHRNPNPWGQKGPHASPAGWWLSEAKPAVTDMAAGVQAWRQANKEEFLAPSIHRSAG